jgi:hypothetical protein
MQMDGKYDAANMFLYNFSNRPKAQFNCSLRTQHSKFAGERTNDNKPIKLVYLLH